MRGGGWLCCTSAVYSRAQTGGAGGWARSSAARALTPALTTRPTPLRQFCTSWSVSRSVREVATFPVATADPSPPNQSIENKPNTMNELRAMWKDKVYDKFNLCFHEGLDLAIRVRLCLVRTTTNPPDLGPARTHYHPCRRRFLIMA